MTGVQILQAIIEILVSGITSIAGAIGGGLSTLAESVFLTTTGSGSDATTTLSVFAVMVVVFAGISLAVGLSKFVVKWIASLGARK